MTLHVLDASFRTLAQNMADGPEAVQGASKVFVIAPLAILIALAVLVAAPLTIGRWVYGDARSRGMDPLMWTLAALFVPGFVGLIVYLAIRSPGPSMTCPDCGRPVTAEYALCPFCGARLKANCPGCAVPVEAEWIVCPRCGTGLEGIERPAPGVPAPEQNRKMSKVMIIALSLPVILFILLVLLNLH